MTEKKPVAKAKPVAMAKPAAKAKPETGKSFIAGIGISRLMGFMGGILLIVGALLPWATVSGGGRTSPETYLGVATGMFGVLLSQLGVFALIMVIDSKKTTLIGGLVMGIFGVVLSGLVLAYMTSLTSFGGEVGITIETGIGLYICVAGAVILMLVSLLALFGIIKPAVAPLQLPKPRGKGKPIEAILLFAFTLAAAVLLLSNPWTFGDTGALGAVFFIFGILLLATSFYVFKVEFWSWGTVLMVMVVVMLFAIPSSTFPMIVLFDTLAFVLYFTRLTFGVGLWKIEQAIEELQRKQREVIRTANPEGLHCPRCMSTDVYICDDGSTYCRGCSVGYVNIKDPSAKPRSSMQGT